jgi:hypothetical protein
VGAAEAADRDVLRRAGGGDAARRGQAAGTAGPGRGRPSGQRAGGLLAPARRAGGWHHAQVLLYHFDGADDLLWQAIWKLRERRIASSLAAADVAQPQTLAARVRAVWPALVGEESPIL